MVGKKHLLVLLFIIGGVLSVNAQSFTYSYINPCNGRTQSVQLSTQSSEVTMFFAGQYRIFTYAELSAGAYEQWVQSIRDALPPGSNPCASEGIEESNNITNFIGSVTANGVANISSVVSMASSIGSSVGNVPTPPPTPRNEGGSNNNNNSTSEGGGEITAVDDKNQQTASGGESENNGEGGGGGKGGKSSSKVSNGALIATGDIVIIRNDSNITKKGNDNFRFNTSLTHVNTSQTFFGYFRFLFGLQSVGADEDEGEAPTREGEEEEGNLQVEGQAVEKDEDRAPVDEIRNDQRHHPVTVEGPTPGAENAGGRPAEFEPEEVADAHGQGEERDEGEEIEGHFRKNNGPSFSLSKKKGLEDVEEIHEEAVDSKEEEVPTELAEAGPGPAAVRADEGADRFRQDRARQGGEKGGEKESARGFPLGKGVDGLLHGGDAVVGEIKPDGDGLKKKEDAVVVADREQPGADGVPQGPGGGQAIRPCVS